MEKTNSDKNLQVPRGYIYATEISPDGNYVIGGMDDGIIRIWDFSTEKSIREIRGHKSLVSSLSLSPDGKYLASASYDNSVKIWDFDKGTLIQTLEDHKNSVTSVVFTPDGNFVISGSKDSIIKAWEVLTGKCIRNLGKHKKYISSIALSPDFKFLISGSGDQTVKFRKVRAYLGLIQASSAFSFQENYTIESVAITPDGNYFAYGLSNGIVKLRTTNKKKDYLQILENHKGIVSSVAFSPDGRLLASGSYDSLINLWEWNTGKLIKTLSGHKNAVLSVKFFPDNKSLISSSADNSIKLWEISTGSIIRTFEGSLAKYINQFLEFEYQNQEELSKTIMIKNFKLTVDEADKIYDLLNSEYDYNEFDMPTLKSKANEVIKNFEYPTLYDLINNLKFDYDTAKKVGKFLLDNGWIKEFPNVPRKDLKIAAPIKETEKVIEISEPLEEFFNLEILRGGDWKIEGNQSIFHYKVKVRNKSKFMITNIQILLTSIPSGILVESDRHIINSLKPNSFESPTFRLKATRSCVGDSITGIVTYIDPKGNQQTATIEPYQIKYVCNLLIPKEVSIQDFEQKTAFMEEKKIILDCNAPPTELEKSLRLLLERSNFFLLKHLEEVQDEQFSKLDAFAQGLYDKQDVALSLSMQKQEEGTKLIIKAMSNEEAKLTDLLKDISTQCDDIKSDTELITEYSAQINDILDKMEDVELYLKEHLASDWEKIKYIWQDYKTGKIGKKELIKQAIKTLGKKFVKIVISWKF